MKQKLFSILLMVGLVLLLQRFTLAECNREWNVIIIAQADDTKSKDENAFNAKKGKEIYEAIQNRYPSVELGALFYNWSGSRCSVMIDLPEEEWERLSSTDKKCLELYAKSLVPVLRANPLKYFPFKGSGASADWYAPGNSFWEKAYGYCKNVCDDCWEIRVGRISESVVSGVKVIEDDRRVAKGNF
ncbi:MAG: hypothetical protein J7M30_17095 [Deltaproteobacteria bacterium]|nr:hypothetical protein [Deltaproteobacteria bacterium]